MAVKKDRHSMILYVCVVNKMSQE